MNEIIMTNSGIVRGCLENGFYIFKGIPYAKAKRFEAPVTTTWEGELDCTSFGKKAMQVFDRVPPGVTPASREEFDEDCLNLNIYVPEDISDTDALPVLLEIHGGGYQDGSNQSRTPAQIVRDQKVIYVAINYRLGVLGYLYLGQAFPTSGNNGLLDQLASIRWIYENIKAFGGDPSRITVLGASAGGKSIGALMMLPEFNNYANQLIISSGSTQSIRSIETSIVTTSRYMETLCSMKNAIAIDSDMITRYENNPDLGLAAELLSCLSADDIIKVQKQFTDNPGNTCMFGPVADGVVIPTKWHDTAIHGTLFEGPVMLGSSRRELYFYQLFNPDMLSAAPAIADALFGINSHIAREEYAEIITSRTAANGCAPSDQEKTDLWCQILTDYMYRCYTYRLAERLARKGCPVWQYSSEFLPALHCSDQSLAFDQPNPMFYKEEEQIQDALAVGTRIWKSFMHFVIYGNPGETDWDPLDPAHKKSMYFDIQSEVRMIPEDDVLSRFPEEVYVLR